MTAQWDEPRVVEYRERAEAALKALGDTPASVAAELRRTGSKGVPGEAHACPVATYLINSGVPVVSVFHWALIEPVGDAGPDDDLVSVAAVGEDYPAVYEFMQDFDVEPKKYKDLRI